jgi:hypothetical protein
MLKIRAALPFSVPNRKCILKHINYSIDTDSEPKNTTNGRMKEFLSVQSSREGGAQRVLNDL